MKSMDLEGFRALALALFLAAGGCAVPSSGGNGYSGGGGGGWPHVTWAGGKDYYPAPGYTWAHKDANGHPIPGDLAVVWNPGAGYFLKGQMQWPNIEASPTEGTWFPRPGYTWVQKDANGHPPPGELAVRWESGLGYYTCGTLAWPHVVSSPTEGKWFPQPGYTWSQRDANGAPLPGKLGVHWEAGRGYYTMGTLTWPHVVSSPTEGKWYPQPGYDWVKRDASGKPIPGEMAVQWTPGRAFSSQGTIQWPNIVSSDQEGIWFPSPGYTWVKHDANGHPPPGELAVKWIPGVGYFECGKCTLPHITAGPTQDRWYPEPGYTWSKLDEMGKPIPGEMAVTWKEGLRHQINGKEVWPHIHAAAKEGIFEPDPGWAWVNPNNDSLAVISTGVLERKNALNDHWAKYLKEIQEQNDFSNWSGPPHDLYIGGTSR